MPVNFKHFLLSGVWPEAILGSERTTTFSFVNKVRELLKKGFSYSFYCQELLKQLALIPTERKLGCRILLAPPRGLTGLSTTGVSMGRNLSPAFHQELANLEKDADSRKSAMKSLKLYMKDLDSKAIPLFLAQVSETKDAGSSYGEYTISLYEVLARVHGLNIVSQIDNIMSSIIKTLTTSGGSFPLQQACSKVVPAIARYGIEPTTPKEKKRLIIHSLCKPLSDSLLCTQKSLSCGVALCLKALVDCVNWRFASDEMVNEVCLKLACALEDEPTQTNSHMGLVMSLTEHNSLIVEAYARLLIHAGLRILNCSSGEKNSGRCLTTIQMLHSLMKWLDIRSIVSELELIIMEMGKCQSESDQMPYVKGAAFEALQTAKRLLADKGSKIESDVVSVTGSNFGRSGNSRSWHLSNSGN